MKTNVLDHGYVAYNEMSARYAPLPDVNYIPTVERLMLGSNDKNKQAGAVGGAAVLTETQARMFQESVNHPAHYNAHPSGVECIDIIEHFTHNVGAAIKYAWRSGLKVADGDDARKAAIEDLQKAAWYISREIERLSKAQ